MPTRLDEITPEQLAQAPAHVEKWIKIGLCTDPADHEAATAAYKACYEAAGIPWHGNVIQAPSPMALAVAAPLAADTYHFLPADDLLELRARAVAARFRDAVEAPSGQALADAIAAVSSEASPLEPGDAGPWLDAVRRPVRAHAAERAMAQAEAMSPDDPHRAKWYNYLGGQGHVAWPAFEEFLREICGLDIGETLIRNAKAYAAAQSVASWWWPHTDFVMYSDRPLAIHREAVEQNGTTVWRLHRTDGPAIYWRDGWGVYMWHGTEVPQHWILDPKNVKPAEVLQHPNAEVRRAGAEIIGWAKLIEGLPHRVIDEDPDPSIGTLVSVDLPDAPDTHILIALCGTGRTVAVPVPPHTTALAANAWSYGLEADEYNPNVRT